MAGVFLVRGMVGVGAPYLAGGARFWVGGVTPEIKPGLSTVLVPAPWLRTAERRMLGAAALTLAELPVLPAAFFVLLASLTTSLAALETTMELISVRFAATALPSSTLLPKARL